MALSDSGRWMFVGLLLTVTTPAAAAVRTWDAGGADSNWTTALNWQGNVAPAAGDALVFPAGVLETTTNNDFPVGTEFASITFAASYSISGNRILVADGITQLEAQTGLITADVALKGGGLGFNFVAINVVAGGLIRLEGVVSGLSTAVLHKVGLGRLRLTEANTYSGATHIDNGALHVTHTQALGNTSARTIAQGGTLELAIAGGGTVAEPLTLTGEGTISTTDGAITTFNPATLSGAITLTGTAASLYVNNAGTLTVTGIVDGAGGLVKDGPGTLDFTGAGANTYAGLTTARAGLLQLGRTGGVSIPSGLTVGDSVGGAGADVVRLVTNEQIAGPITVASSGLLDLVTHVEVVNTLTMTGGKITSTGAGLLTLDGDVTIALEFAAAVIEGRLALGSATRTFSVTGSVIPALDVTAIVSGPPAGGLIKTGSGWLRLDGANTYQGPTTVQQGPLMVGDPLALGAASAGTTVVDGGSLHLSVNVAAEPLDGHRGTFGPLTMYCDVAGTAIWGGPITIDGHVGFYVPAGCTLRLNGAIGGPGNLQVSAAAASSVLELGAVNTYAGVTQNYSNGVLRLATNNAIPDSGNVNLNGSTLDLAGFSDTIRLNASPTAKVMLGAGTLTVSSPEFTFNTCEAVISGSGKLVKQGLGRTRLTAQNTYTGLTTVEEGTLLLEGRLEGPVKVTGGVLGGDGYINDSLTATGGRVSPSFANAGGQGTGTFGALAVTLHAGAIVSIDINGQTSGTQHDQLEGNNVITLNSPTLELFANPNLQISNLGEIIILRNDTNGDVVGTFNGLAEGSTISSQGKSFRISYQGGDGNDVSLVPAKRDYYLSEGATGAFFDLDILVANPNAAAAAVTFTFLLPDGSTRIEQRTVGAFARLTLNVDTLAGLTDTAVSTVVTSDDGAPIVVERTMRWDQSGYGAHTEKAAGGTALKWYFAEGSQGFFSTYLLLANPNTGDIGAAVTFLREGAAPVVRTYIVPAKSRVTVDASADPDLVGFSFGMHVSFDGPGVAERAMYFGADPLWKGGHESTGATTASANWFLAEGATGPFFETYVLIANPDDLAASGTITYLPTTGVPVSKPFTVPAAGRLTINLEAEDPSLTNAAVATQVTADRPIIVERAQYWPDPAPQWYEAHNSFGITELGMKWGLAEGRVGGAEGYQTYVLLANPGDFAAQVTITFLRENGDAFSKSFSVPAKSRFNVDTGAGTLVPELVDERFGALIVSDQPIAVERAMYSNANGQVWAAGTNATATALP